MRFLLLTTSYKQGAAERTTDYELFRMRFIIKRSGALLATLLAGIILASCNDTPTTIGSDYLPQNVEFGSYTLKPDDFEIVSGIAAASNSSAQSALGLLLGEAPDGTTAHGLLAITSESPAVSGSAAKPVTGASLVLYTLPYRYGDTTANLTSFDVVVLDEVFPFDAKWDDALIAKIASAPSLGTFNGTYPLSDDDSVQVQLDVPLTQQFLQEYFRYDNLSTGREFRTLKSLALRSRSGGRIVGGYFGVLGVNDSLRPALRVVTADTTITLRAGSTNWIAKSNLETGAGKIAVMAGLPVRTFIKVKLDSIPAQATIHQAELRLFVDEANTTHGTFGPSTSLVAYIGTDSSLNQRSYLTSGISGIVPVSRTALDSNTFTNMFRFTALAPTISAWLRNRRGEGTVANNGLILSYYRGANRPDLETTTVDRLKFHGFDAADPNVRPSLTITYSIQVDANK